MIKSKFCDSLSSHLASPQPPHPPHGPHPTRAHLWPSRARTPGGHRQIHAVPPPSAPFLHTVPHPTLPPPPDRPPPLPTPGPLCGWITGLPNRQPLSRGPLPEHSRPGTLSLDCGVSTAADPTAPRLFSAATAVLPRIPDEDPHIRAPLPTGDPPRASSAPAHAWVLLYPPPACSPLCCASMGPFAMVLWRSWNTESPPVPMWPSCRVPAPAPLSDREKRSLR